MALAFGFAVAGGGVLITTALFIGGAFGGVLEPDGAEASTCESFEGSAFFFVSFDFALGNGSSLRGGTHELMSSILASYESMPIGAETGRARSCTVERWRG